jgi:signal transduction histidine kinase
MQQDDRLNILMVDDQPSKLLTYEAVLASLGENLIRANSAREALDTLLKVDIDIILLDVSMPDMDGFALASLIREHPRYQRTAIIFVSAVHMTEFDHIKGYEAGGLDYVSVPIVPEILRAKVAVFAELYRKTRQLQRLNEELEMRVRERTADLDRRAVELHQLNGELRHRNQELDAFGYVVSHDLKAPLRGINSYAQILLEENGAVLGEESAQMLGRLVTISGRMASMLDSLLHYARLGRAELVLTTTDMHVAVEEAVELLAIDLRERGVEVRIPRRLPSVQAHAVHVGEIFTNLIANATKYNDKDQRWIEISHLEPAQPGEPVVFCVRDNGIGIEPGDREKVFELFHRLHSEEAYGGGVGAGLTIVKRIIDRHGGRIWVESRPGEGAAFYFTLAPAVPDATVVQLPGELGSEPESAAERQD